LTKAESTGPVMLTWIEIVGKVAYINGDERWPIHLPSQWDSHELVRLVLDHCRTDYDDVNYVDEQHLEEVCNAAVRKYFNGKDTGIDNGNGRTMKQGSSTADGVICELARLTDIDDPRFAGKTVKVKAVVASNSTSYNVPKGLFVECSKGGQHKCPGEKDILLEPIQIARYPDSRHRDNLNLEFAEAHFSKKCLLTIKEVSDTLYRVRVRPHVTSLIFQDGKTTDESGMEYKPYDIFMMGRHDVLEPGSVYEITAVVIPDPRSQKVTLFATELAKDASSEYDLQKIRDLKQVLEALPLEGRVRWIQENFQRYSQVRKREDVILASFLTSFSPLWIHFDGKTERGWLIALVIGDSTTGKSETVKRMIRLLNGGQLVVAETSSMVGLSATATQTTNGWFVEWGPLVLQDMRLLAIDGAQKLSRQEWSTLAEAIRLGTIKLTKAARGEAHARTRQVLIANPVDFETRGTKEMDAFLYPYLALPSILDPINIARLDLAVFVNAGDVNIEDINKSIEDGYNPLLHNLQDLRAYVWQSKYKMQYGDGFAEEIHRQATELHNRYFVKAVPLLSIDLKFKLVRLSAALALGTCSFNEELDSVIVTREHVTYIANYLDRIYRQAGFAESKDDSDEASVSIYQVETIADSIAGKLGLGSDNPGKARQILQWAGQQTTFTKDLLKAKFSLVDKEELRPIVNILRSEGLIDQGRGGFHPTSRGVQVARLLKTGGHQP
jgi:hypothetical protein